MAQFFSDFQTSGQLKAGRTEIGIAQNFSGAGAPFGIHFGVGLSEKVDLKFRYGRYWSYYQDFWFDEEPHKRGNHFAIGPNISFGQSWFSLFLPLAVDFDLKNNLSNKNYISFQPRILKSFEIAEENVLLTPSLGFNQYFYEKTRIYPAWNLNVFMSIKPEVWKLGLEIGMLHARRKDIFQPGSPYYTYEIFNFAMSFFYYPQKDK
ncbi:MAG: hypothetical protein JJU28_16680 [Cyclobacteriaceae bacterium]|nr:hypothetical protein [Cyclobacteriaceae bacterium]